MWEALLRAERTLSISEIAEQTGLVRRTVESALLSLSCHWVPVYEEQQGRTLYFGVAKPISHEQMDEIICYTNDKEKALGTRDETKFDRNGHKERSHG